MSGPTTSQYLESQFGLAGKVAVVTGGSGTLCSVIAQGLAQAGAKVILWGRDAAKLDAKKAMIDKACGEKRSASVQVDQMEEAGVKKAVEDSVKVFGRVDILVNGAGGNRGKAFLTETKAEDIEYVLKLNLVAGCIYPSKHFADYWIKNKVQGNIINISSMAGFNPLSQVYAYSAAKAAVMNHTLGLSKELAVHNIRVNSVAPGFFVADQNRALLLNPDGTPTARGKSVMAHTPFNRFGEPHELIGACLFLAADKASGFVTGVNLAVDGGYMAWNI